MTSQAPRAKRLNSLLDRKLLTKRNTNLPQDPSLHPCNRVRFGGKKHVFTVNLNKEVIVCHQLNETELLSVEKCPGGDKQAFAATKLDKALANAAKLFKRFSSHGGNHGSARVKRQSSIRMKPNETMICNCESRRSIDFETGYARSCGVCASIYRQATSNRFPRYLNGIVCHPNETETVYVNGSAVGKCIQKTITQDLLEWRGKWEIDPVMTQRVGLNIYKQKWEPYAQVIQSSCVFQFLTT